MRTAITAVVAMLAAISTARAEIIKVEYEGFTVWVDCARRGPTLFHYVAKKDSGSRDRSTDYKLDPNVPARCQSTSNELFQTFVPAGAADYDVGHQVPANHFDGSSLAIRQTNFWTNLLPQTKSMNRGAWLQTEYLIECIRDEVPLEIWGGPIWGNNFDDDHFFKSHGVRTPTAFWKVVIRTDNRRGIAWIIPNGDAPAGSLDEWIESISTVERVVGRTFKAANKTSRPSLSWARPTGCSVR